MCINRHSDQVHQGYGTRKTPNWFDVPFFKPLFGWLVVTGTLEFCGVTNLPKWLFYGI